MAFQHLTQKRYLDRWNLNGHLYLINKNTMNVTPFQSAKSILGMEDIQTPAMETAFGDVESCIGNIHTQGQLTDPKDVRKLAKWIALHAIRCKRYAHVLATLDYRGDVEKLADYFQQHHAVIRETRQLSARVHHLRQSLPLSDSQRHSFLVCTSLSLSLRFVSHHLAVSLNLHRAGHQ